MQWASEWVGIPHAKLGRGPDSFDCLGLFLALQKARFGRVLPDPRCTMLQAAREKTADQMRPLFRRVEKAEEGDALLFRVKGQLLHVGYALDGRDMIHTGSDTGDSRIERWNGTIWLGRLEGIYRFADA